MLMTDIMLNSDNPRFITDKQFKKLVKSIKEFPEMMEYRPIIIDSESMIICGNMRYRALLELGYTDIPNEWVKSAENLTQEQIRRFIIVDNLSFGSWDKDILANEWDAEDLINWGMNIKEIQEQEEEEHVCPFCGGQL